MQECTQNAIGRNGFAIREIVGENVFKKLNVIITVKSLVGFSAMNFDERRNYQNPSVKVPVIEARAALRIARCV